ncbi:hypothetical protein HPB50_012268 [Hyalomma asiaticum]|uniref:Uncharacterized protein n=1 Tax=Hyalomma asiaticum TaxID=266040 RepID=A0ACB7S5P7_HYAAI|nr:hypothetical protein HPB50_012268 [Hyalomma asiaticum]
MIFRGGRDATWPSLADAPRGASAVESSGSNGGGTQSSAGIPFSGQTARMSVAQPVPAEWGEKKAAERKRAREAANRAPTPLPGAVSRAAASLLLTRFLRSRAEMHPGLLSRQHSLCFFFPFLTLSLSWPLNIHEAAPTPT